MSATIPMSRDVASLIGDAAQHVENRSLLLDKYVFHKQWPVVEEQFRGKRNLVKWDEASRWSFMRIADGASQILTREAQEKRRRAEGRNVNPENVARFQDEAKIAETLARVKWASAELQSLRKRHTRHLLSLFRKAYGDRAAITIGQLEGRLAINLADSLIQNAGICLDRIFGLPYIPGSAVKGVSRHAALAQLKAATDTEAPELLEIFCSVFGTSEGDFKSGDLKVYRPLLEKDADRKGAVSFLPAYPVNEARIVVDLTNVHYPDYYRTGRTEDLSQEKPRPNPFPAVECGAQFAFCLVLNGMDMRPEILAAARRWLESALTERGLGAKTASGYGWFSLQPQILSELEAEATREREAAEAEAARIPEEEAELKRISGMSPEEAAAKAILELSDEKFAAFARNLADKSEPEQRAFIGLLTNNKEKRDRWKTWKKKKPEIVQTVESVRASLQLPSLP